MTALPDLMRRLDRKLDIQRGLTLSYDDLALLVATGAYAKLQEAVEDEARAHDLPRIRQGCAYCDPFIYFMRAGDSGPIKIGFTKNVEQRRLALQPSTHEPIVVLAAVGAPQVEERALHCHFEEEHIRGEWFRASPRLLNFIESIRPAS